MGDKGPDPGLVLPPDVSYDEKKSVLHKLDSLSLLLYTFLLTLTVVTIWLFKHRSGQGPDVATDSEEITKTTVCSF